MGEARKGGRDFQQTAIVHIHLAGSNARRGLFIFLPLLFPFLFLLCESAFDWRFGVIGGHRGHSGICSYGHELDEDLNIGLAICFCVLAGFGHSTRRERFLGHLPGLGYQKAYYTDISTYGE